MDILGKPPEKWSNNEKRLDAAFLRRPGLVGNGSSFYIRIWAKRQYRTENPKHPDYPFFSDWRLYAQTCDFVKLSLLVEADDNYFHVHQRARDYRKDITNLLGSSVAGHYSSMIPTIRFDSERIFKNADACVEESITVLIRLLAKKLDMLHGVDRDIDWLEGLVEYLYKVETRDISYDLLLAKEKKWKASQSLNFFAGDKRDAEWKTPFSLSRN